jgi:hypothetical protein
MGRLKQAIGQRNCTDDFVIRCHIATASAYCNIRLVLSSVYYTVQSADSAPPAAAGASVTKLLLLLISTALLH